MDRIGMEVKVVMEEVPLIIDIVEIIIIELIEVVEGMVVEAIMEEEEAIMEEEEEEDMAATTTNHENPMSRLVMVHHPHPHLTTVLQVQATDLEMVVVMEVAHPLVDEEVVVDSVEVEEEEKVTSQ